MFYINKVKFNPTSVYAALSISSILLLSIPSAQAAMVQVSGNWDIVNKTGQAANDFHMDVYSDSNLIFHDSFNGVFSNFSHGQSPFNPLVKKYDWSGGTVPNGGKTHIGVELWQNDKNGINIQDSYWTKDGQKIGSSVKLPGFDVTPFGGPPGSNIPSRLRLFNDTSEQIFIHDFSYSINALDTPLDMLMFNESGLNIPVSDFSIAPNSFSDVFNDVEIPSGYFLVFQGRSCEDVDCAILSGNFVGEHLHASIPEPTSTLSFLALGTLGATSTLKRKLKSSKSTGQETTKVG